MTETIAILDHESHSLFIDEVDTDLIEQKYNGEEEAYILDNYELGEFWTWNYVTNIQRFTTKNNETGKHV